MAVLTLLLLGALAVLEGSLEPGSPLAGRVSLFDFSISCSDLSVPSASTVELALLLPGSRIGNLLKSHVSTRPQGRQCWF